MFKHKSNPSAAEENEIAASEVEQEKESTKKEQKEEKVDLVKGKELMEKNLKWSQIIYEQNRKINHKLMWAAIFGWLRLLIILVPLALAVWYLPPLVKDVWKQYGGLLGVMSSDSKNQSSSMLLN